MSAFEVLVFIMIILTLTFGCVNAYKEIKSLKSANKATIVESQ